MPTRPGSATLKEIMSESRGVQRRHHGTAPWVVAAILALVVAALAVLLVHAYSVRDDNDARAGARYRPTADQLEAVQVGATEAANLTTLSRKNFEADYRRALTGTTGQLRKDIAAKKQDYLAAMTSGKFDLKATVARSAFESASGDRVLVLVTLNGAHVVDGARSSVSTPQRIELTMVRSGGTWLASNFLAVGVS
jgi:hypothetical protein